MTDPRDAVVAHATVPDAATPETAAAPDGAAATPEDAAAAPGNGQTWDGPGRRPGRTRPSVQQALRRRIEGTSLLTRLVGILVIALLVALTVAGYASQWLLRGYLTQQAGQQLRDQVGPAVGAALRAVRDPYDGDTTRPLPGGFVVQLWDGSSAVRTSVPDSLSTEPAFPTLEADEYATSSHAITLRTLGSTSGSKTWLMVAAAVRTNPAGDITYAQVALPLSVVDSTVGRLQLLLILLGAFVIVICLLFGSLAIQRSFRPLVEVEETAAAIAAGDLSRRIPERPATTEVGRLTASLNGMLTQIESAFRAREASEARTRRFAADASHELRTPLASIRGFAELFRQGAVPSEEVPRTMRRIEDEAKRMGSLVEDLLLLARLDEQRPSRRDAVDLAVLAGDAVHDAKGLDADRRVRLVGLTDTTGPTPSVVVGDEDKLRQVVANLVGNAVRHTAPGTPVEVAVGRDSADRAVLEVRDHGAGLAPDVAERVFERFFRLDSSRQRGQGGGSGLGLSIVSAVVAAHGGTVTVLATPDGGATFRVELPAQPIPSTVGVTPVTSR